MKTKIVPASELSTKTLRASDYIMKPPRNEGGGGISTEHTVWCGRCWRWHQASSGTVRWMAKIARKAGWEDRAYYGWCCPDCVKEINEGKETIGYRTPGL